MSFFEAGLPHSVMGAGAGAGAGAGERSSSSSEDESTVKEEEAWLANLPRPPNSSMKFDRLLATGKQKWCEKREQISHNVL